MLASRTLRYTGLGLLAAVLAVGPFLRGLFFWTELLAGIAAVSLGFGLWLMGRRIGRLPFSPPGGTTGFALLALLAAYLLQFAWAAYARGNIDWVLRVFAAWAAYVMFRAEAGPALRRWLSWTLVLTGTGLSLLGFLEFTGFFTANPEMIQALGVVSLAGRMATPLQYPNTAAVYLLAALVAGIGLALDDPKPWKLAVTGGLGTLLSLAFFFTVSRGAVVVLPLGLLALFLGLDGDKRWPALLQLLAVWAPVVVALNGVGANAAIHNYVSAFRWIIAASCAGTIGGLAVAYLQRLSGRQRLVLMTGAAVLAAAVFAVWRPALPKQAARLLDINLRTVNVVIRFTYYQDAATMVADQPLGRGGWGWERSYRRYQDYYYIGRETHNQYLQTAVEAGLPGAVALIAAVGAGLWGAWRSRRGNALGWTLATGAVVLAAHSAIDFDLSYGSVWLLLWCLLALADGPAVRGEPSPAVWRSAVASAAGVALFAAILGVGSWYADRADVLAAAGDWAPAKAAAVTAGRLDPWNSAPLMVMGDKASLERAIKLDPWQSRPRFDLAVVLENAGDYDGARREARAAVANAPFVSAGYTKLASVAGNVMVTALHEGDVARGRELAGELAALGRDFLQRQAQRQAGRPWMGPPLAMSPVFKLRYGQSLYLMGDAAGAESYLAEASKVGLLGSEADVWLYALYEERGSKKAMAALEGKPWIRFRNVNPVYKVIRGWRP